MNRFTVRYFLLSIFLCLTVSCQKLDSASHLKKNQSERTARSAQEIRNFLADLVEVSGLPKEKVAAEYRIIVARHPQVAVIALLEDPVKVLKEAGFPELGKTTEVVILKEVGQTLRAVPVLREVSTESVKGISDLSVNERELVLREAGDGPFIQLQRTINSEIESFDIAKSEAMVLLNDPSKGIAEEEMTGKFREIYGAVKRDYFRKLPPRIKRNIASSLLRLPANASPAKQLGVALNKAGPVLQKLFQLIGSRSQAEELAQVMAELKSNITPFDGNEARAIIERETGKKITDLFSEFNTKPLAAASVGQAHSAKLKGSNQEVIVKVLRPGVAEAAAEEMATLRSIITGSAEQEILDEIERVLYEEIDLRFEAEHLKSGKAYNTPSLGIAAVKHVNSIPATKNVLVMERAPGVSLHSSQLSLEVKAAAMTNLLEMWTDRAWFGDGYFHADLHSGNIFIRENVNSNLGYEMTMIDFGSSSRLSKVDQRALTKMSVGVEMDTPELVLAALEDYQNPPSIAQRQKYKITISSIIAREVDVTTKLGLILGEAETFGYRAPKALVMYSRGVTFLTDQLDDLNAQLVKAGKKAGLDSHTVISNTATKRLTRDLFVSLFSKDADMRKLTYDIVIEVFRSHASKASANVKTFLKECKSSFVEMIATSFAKAR